MASPDKDKRLYMTFPNDFHRHPKLTRLAPEVRWAFVEMNGEARLADNDGVFPADDAEFLWPAETLAALLTSHPKRPLVERDAEGNYVIREYDKHQQTKADREDLSAKRAKAAQARWGNAKQPDASALQQQSASMQTHAESESESESESPLPDLLLTESVSLDVSRANKNDRLPNKSNSRPVDPRRIADLVETICDIVITEPQANELSAWVVSQSPDDVRHPHAYTERAIKNDPSKIIDWIDTEMQG